jgi:two-component system response regulator NreC
VPTAPGASIETVDIVIADDHRLVREGLRLVLEHERDIRVVGEAADVGGTERVLRECRPAVLLLDIFMDHDSSVPALPMLHRASPSTAIVVLTMETHPLVAREALRRGAAGYVAKHVGDAELIAAVRAAAEGRTYLDPQLGARLAVEPWGEPDELSERDIEILRLVALGHTNPEIAKVMYLSVRTVEAYRLDIQRRLGLSRRAKVVDYVRAHRLIG